MIWKLCSPMLSAEHIVEFGHHGVWIGMGADALWQNAAAPDGIRTGPPGCAAPGWSRPRPKKRGKSSEVMTVLAVSTIKAPRKTHPPTLRSQHQQDRQEQKTRRPG